MTKIQSTVSVSRTSKNFDGYGVTGRLYDVCLDGTYHSTISAANYATAKSVAKKALAAAYASEWNQNLIFRGELAPGAVSSVQFGYYLSKQ